MGYTIGVLGLDGLSWGYYRKLAEAGIIPRIKSIIKRSLKFHLYAFPPVTYPSWINIMTGVSPLVHGIYGFLYVDRSGKLRVYTSADLMHPRVHEIYGFIGRKAFIINPIPPSPLFDIRGVHQVSTIFTPTTYYCSPRGFCEKYRGTIEAVYYSLTRDKKLNAEQMIEEGVKYVSNIINLLETITLKNSYDLYWITLPYPDMFLHKVSGHEYLSEKIVPGEERLFSIIDKLADILYKLCDYIIIVSDHGFSSYHSLININQLLYSNGYIILSKTRATSSTLEHYEIMGRKRRGRVKTIAIPRFLASPRIRRLFGFARSIIRRAGVKIAYPTPDPKLSKAYMPYRYSFGVRVNDKSILDDVIKLLSNSPHIERVISIDPKHRKHKIEPPIDILIEPCFDKGYYIGYTDIRGEYITKRFILDHHPVGVFAIYAKSSIPSCSKNVISTVTNDVVGATILLIGRAPISSYSEVNGEYIDILVKNQIIDSIDIQRTNMYVARWNMLKKIKLGGTKLGK